MLRGLLEKTPPADVIRVANQMLISTLTKNLARMEPSTKRNAVRHADFSDYTDHHFLIFSEGSLIVFVCFFLYARQIEGVCALLAKQGAGVREKAAFVVLICALLQTLESLNESTHLHTAQIILRLLEPSLRKLYALKTDKVLTLSRLH